MSGAADANARALAAQQITRFGTTGTLTRDATVLAQDQPCMELENGDQHFRQDSIQATDRFFMLPASLFPVEPAGGDMFTVGDDAYLVQTVKRVKPGLDAIIYYVRVGS